MKLLTLHNACDGHVVLLRADDVHVMEKTSDNTTRIYTGLFGFASVVVKESMTQIASMIEHGISEVADTTPLPLIE